MNIKFSDVLDLFELVNFGSQFDHEGYICKSSGKTYFRSNFCDDEELPDDINNDINNDINDEKYLSIPHKSELDLGINLPFDFIQEYLPTEYDNVRSIFSRKGAYAKFKLLLDHTGKVDEWHIFEAKRTEQAVRGWCLEQDIGIDFSK